MHASASPLAALRDGRSLARNAAWLGLARRVGPWRVAEPGAPPAGAAYPTLEAAVLVEAEDIRGAEGAARVRRYARDGAEETFDVRLETIPVPGTRPLVLAMIAEVTEWVRREREAARLRERDRLRAIGELASGVAHDLNNTFHALGLRLSRLHAPAAAEQRERDLAVVERVIADAAERVRRLQDLARRRHDRPDERVDLRAVVADAVEAVRAELARGDGAPVVLEVDVPPLPAVLGSGAELRHVVVSLLLNARDAMPAGGHVRLTGRTTSGGAAEVTVEDEGHGIAAEHLGRLFDPFFTTKGTQGSGLGLAIARSVLDRIGGDIRAANRPERGAAFTLSFPLAAPSEAPAPPAPPATEPARDGEASGARRRVLVVDDDADNLDAMRLVLEQYGHEVEVADTGGAAVRLAASGHRFDVVFCDLGLPDVDGWEVAAAIRAEQPDARVFLVTGWAAEIAPDDPRRANVAEVLAKPLDIPALRRVLRDAWRAARSPRVARDAFAPAAAPAR